MICVVIAKCTYEEALETLSSADCAEIRLDLLDLTEAEIRGLCSLPGEIVATNRAGRDEPATRMQMLKTAIDAGVSYVDIEVEADDEYREDLMKYAHAHGTQVIISYHNFTVTPDLKDLRCVVEQCFHRGADVAKVACKVRSVADSARLLGLLDSERKLIIVGMGEAGRLTRIVAPFLGSLFTYAASAVGMESAPGQIGKGELEKLISTISEHLS